MPGARADPLPRRTRVAVSVRARHRLSPRESVGRVRPRPAAPRFLPGDSFTAWLPSRSPRCDARARVRPRNATPDRCSSALVAVHRLTTSPASKRRRDFARRQISGVHCLRRAQRQVWVRLVGGGAALQLTRDDSTTRRRDGRRRCVTPLLLPAGRRIAGTLWEVPALGDHPGVSPTRSAVVTSAMTASGSPSSSSRRIRSSWSSRRATARPRARSPACARVLLPLTALVPYDQLVAYQRGYVFTHDIYAVPANGGEVRQITREARPDVRLFVDSRRRQHPLQLGARTAPSCICRRSTSGPPRSAETEFGN